MNIPEHRKAIDQLDAKIVKLLNERTQHVLEIGAIKFKAGEEIYAPHRELAVLQRVCRLNKGPITNDAIRAIYREVMSSALSLQKTMRIAYLGPEATFTHQAAIRRFGSSLRYGPQKTITDVFAEVSKNRADYGVVPIENSTEGVVTHTLDMFVDSDLKIVSQIVLRVQHCLLSNSRKSPIIRSPDHPVFRRSRDFHHGRNHHVGGLVLHGSGRSPPRFDFEPRGNDVTFEFHDLSLGYEFRAVNAPASHAGGLTSA